MKNHHRIRDFTKFGNIKSGFYRICLCHGLSVVIIDNVVMVAVAKILLITDSTYAAISIILLHIYWVKLKAVSQYSIFPQKFFL